MFITSTASVTGLIDDRRSTADGELPTRGVAPLRNIADIPVRRSRGFRKSGGKVEIWGRLRAH
jgi:hypothetical protein